MSFSADSDARSQARLDFSPAPVLHLAATPLETGTNPCAQTSESTSHLSVALGLLKTLTLAATLDELIEGIVEFVQQRTGCEAVAVRLAEGCDFPFYVARGFDQEFVALESSLCHFDTNGWPATDEHGRPVLQCMCGSIIQGRFSRYQHACTAAGSFVVNDVDAFLETTPPDDLPADLRGRCVQQGFKSIAIIPLRIGEETVGVLHLCDRRRGVFPAALVQVLEELGDSLATLITRHRSLVAAESSARSYQDLVESAEALVFRLDAEGKIQYCNRFAEEFFGYRRDELIGRSPVGTVLPETEASGRDLAQMIQDIMQHPERYRLNENENMTKDGRRVWLAWTNRPLYNDAGDLRGLLCVGTDVSRHHRTERELLERQTHLRSVASQLVIEEERDRRRLAVDLHEDAAQILAYCKMRAAALLECDLAPPARALASELDGNLLQVLGRLRAVSLELSPSALYELGLVQAIEALARHVTEQTGVKVQVRQVGPELRLTQEQQIALYHAVRQLLGLAVQRQGARLASVSVEATKGLLTLEVRDDGQGFEGAQSAAATLEGQHGLFSLQQRMEHFQGDLKVQSSARSGTRVRIELPYDA